MNENSLLALLAKLCGDITIANNPDAEQVFQLQQAIAAAIINDPGLISSGPFQFEELEHFSTKHLDAGDLEHLNNVLQRAKDNRQPIDTGIRIFKREVPVISSQLRGSVPDWARGAKISSSIGPVINKDGRRIWIDIYRVIPLVQVWLQGAAQPFLLLPLEVSNFILEPKNYSIPKGSAWIHADVFQALSPDSLFCGLTISAGTLDLSASVTVDASNRLVLPNGISATINLNLDQKLPSDVSPDNHGIDAKESAVSLPASLSFTISHAGSKINAVANAKWKLYGQDIGFVFDANAPCQWNPVLNRILIPFKASVPDMECMQCKSPAFHIAGKAPIAGSSWALSAAAININAPLEADGTGAITIGILHGLEAGWPGLKDTNLFETGTATLKNALVTLMPGRINISTLFASDPGGRQRYELWQETADAIEKPVQHVDLLYTSQFFFFYDSLQQGIETLAVQANCSNSIDKPVKVDGSPFAVESLQTIVILSYSKAFQTLMLYDDTIILDNWLKEHPAAPGVPEPPVQFETTAIALNNALLTISPVYSMLLYGDLKNETRFDKCLLVYSFGLLQYLPSLPDPYAANFSLMRRRRFAGRAAAANAGEADQQLPYGLTDINSMLVCMLSWSNMEAPAISFFMGDRPLNPNHDAGNILSGSPLAEIPRIGFINNENILLRNQRIAIDTKQTMENRSWQTVTESTDISAMMLNNDYNSMAAVNQGLAQDRISPFSNAFTLVDVSTNADLAGISLGFVNDDFIFRKTHIVKEEINGSPVSINGMDVHATSRLVQLYALPQISWEPVINLSDVTNTATDPYPGLLLFLNDGVPAQIANTNSEPVSLAPIPLSKKLTEWYRDKDGFAAWSYFTLPYGMLALAMYYKEAGDNNPAFELIEKKFAGDLSTGLQLKTVGRNDTINKNKMFYGSAHQLSNTYNVLFPGTGARSILSGSVTEIFNDEFGTLGGFDINKYVPLERYDFSGYGANLFSHWVNANAALAQTSQAMFDVWRGRTAHEVIQVKSVIYPWGIRVVRTITIYRGGNAFTWRTDSGWKAESDGIYDFRTPIKDDPADSPALHAAKDQERARAYLFHPGMVEGVYKVRNIKEDITLAPFTASWNKTTGLFIDDLGHPKEIVGSETLDVKLVPVYFDADVQIDDVTQGANNGRVSSRRMLGYLQLRPRGVFIDQEQFAALLLQMQGLGGPVDCMVNINQSKQQMRITRVEVNPSMDASNKRVFVAAAKGTPVLPKDGSWSVVQHDAASREVTPLSNNDVIPLIREGLRNFVPDTIDYTQDKLTKPVNVAEASELFKAIDSRAKQFGFLQSTAENKILFRNPLFERGTEILKGSIPDLADAYRLMNSKGIFPKLENLPKIDQLAADYEMRIRDEGYKLLNKIDPAKILQQVLPEGPWYIVKTNDVKVYVEYKPTRPDGSPVTPGAQAKLDLDIDSTASKWLNKMNDITMVVDLGSFNRLLLIRGKFDTKKGEAPSFTGPELEFGPDLKPVVDILVLLSEMAINPNYTDILKKGLKIAMSNSPNNWEYKFQADKEIPVLRFPPPNLDTTAAPLRLEASLKAGVYFNVAVPLPPVNGVPAPSAGAFVEFYGKLSVMCVSVGVGSIYAVGQVTLRISADTVTGPALYMKFGFGVEAVVALPVIGSISVYFAVGVEINLDSTQITIGGFVLFRGRADLLGGIVTVTILIEASGKVQQRIGGASGETNMIAQVTFSLDISICFIIDISFSESWQEQKQIA